jgi:hypothetical protein
MSIAAPEFPAYGPNSHLDPAGAIPYLTQLPTMNRDNDVGAIMRGLEGLIPPNGDVSRLPGIWHSGGALALQSDIDMGVSSALRLGADPIQEYPDLTPMMLRTAAVAHEVNGAPAEHPRSVVDGYVAPRFIQGAGYVAFRGIGSELSFLTETRYSHNVTREAAAVMSEMDFQNDPVDELVARLDFAAEQIGAMMHSTLRVMKVYAQEPLGPFAEVHQPFFRPAIIGGKQRDASGAAQMPPKEVEWFARGLGANTGVGEQGYLLANGDFHQVADGDEQEAMYPMAEGARYVNSRGDAHQLGRFYLPNIQHTPVGRRKEVEKFERTNGQSVFHFLKNLSPSDPRRMMLTPAYLRLMSSFTSFGSAHGAGVARDFTKRTKGAKGGGGYDNVDLRLLLQERRAHLHVARIVLSQKPGPYNPAAAA